MVVDNWWIGKGCVGVLDEDRGGAIQSNWKDQMRFLLRMETKRLARWVDFGSAIIS
jgi:hypothetical protein